MVRVSALGAVRAWVGGEPVDLGGPRQRAVLGMLVAAGGRVVSTDRFVEDLWSGEPPPKALGALQAYVSHLRRLLEPDRAPRRPATRIVSTAPGYALALPEQDVDTWAFAALVREASRAGEPAEVVRLVDRARELWAGEPFAAYADHAWAAREIDRLRELRATAVELRAAAVLDLGGAAEPVADLEELTAAHPLRERAAALLALALYRSGRQGDALAALRRVRRELADELGVDPGPDVRSLEADILAHAAHLRPPVVAAPAVRPPDPDDDFVGRSAELARLRAVRPTTRPVLVWIEGDAGIGKSALLDRFCAGAGTTWTVARGRCAEVSGAPPGWAWHAVVRALTGADPAAERAFGLTEELRRAVAAADRPAVVVLDDLHRADEETLQVLRHLVTTAETPLLLVGTFRPDEVGPDLAAALASTAERTADRIVLGGLDPAAARLLLRRHVGTELPDAVWERLVDRAAGNALFLRQLGQLVASEGVGAGTTELPLGIRDLLDRRIDRLPGPTVGSLARAAVLGRDVDVDLLLDVDALRGGRTEDELVDDLDAAVVAGLLHAPAPGELRFTHALIRDTCYDRVPPLRRARLHLAVLDELEGRPGPEAVFARAHHAVSALRGATADRLLPHLVDGARHAQQAGATADAATYWRAVLRAHELGAGSVGLRLEAHRELVRAVGAGGDQLGAGAARAESIRVAQEIGTVTDVARAWVWEVPSLWSSRPFADRDDVVERITDLLDRIDPSDERLRADLLISRAYESEAWGLAVSRPSADEALEIARRLGDPRLLCRALNVGFLHTHHHADAGFAARTGREMLDVAVRAGLLDHQALAHLILVTDAVGRADPDGAAGHLRAAVAAGTTGQLPGLLLAASLFDVTFELLRGGIDGARTGFAAAMDRLDAAGEPNSEIVRLWAEFTVEHAAGDTSVLLPRLLELHGRYPAGVVDDQLATALLDAGETDRARALWPTPGWPRNSSWLSVTALRADLAVRFGDRDEARRCHAALLPWTGQLVRSLNGVLVHGPVDGYLARTAEAFGDADAARHHRAEAERIAHRLRG